jgi:hypothetical protein
MTEQINNDERDVSHPAVTGSTAKTEPHKEHSTPTKSDHHSRRTISISDLFNPYKPWILQEDGLFLPMFNFVPKHLRTGPWSPIATLTLFALMYSIVMILIGANIQQQQQQQQRGRLGGWMIDDFQMAPDAYQAYTIGWYYNVCAFLWMCYVSWSVMTESALSTIAWVSFTLWSWTIITIRHGLCVVAPFLPSIRVYCEWLRLPVLLSASVTFGVWNFILLPGITLFLITDPIRRKNFLSYMTNFRLTQLHIFNIGFATLNGYYIEPRRPLHVGDINIITIYMTLYLLFYYCVLDRVGIHLYPIFSPRASWVIFSWILLVSICMAGYQFWDTALSARA